MTRACDSPCPAVGDGQALAAITTRAAHTAARGAHKGKVLKRRPVEAEGKQVTGPLPQHEPPELPSPGSYGRTPPQGSPPWLDAAQVHTWPWAGCCAAPKSVCSSPTPHGTALGRRASGLQEVMMGSGLLKSHETAHSPSLVPPT